MKRETKLRLLNSLLAGALVFLGAFTDGSITWQGAFIALLTSMGVAILQFKEYIEGEIGEYKSVKLFKFL